LHPAILLVLGYALGPFGIGMTRRGRRSGSLTGFTAAWTVVALLIGVAWWSVATGRGPGTLVPLLTVVTGAALLAAFMVWTRSLHLLLSADRFPGKPWPEWMRNPWAAVAMGLLAPGSAYVIARKPGRVLATVWSFWPGVSAIAILAMAPVIWPHRDAFAAWGLGSEGLEIALLAMAAVATVTPLMWIAQALQGARAVAARQQRWQDAHGGRYALALVAVVVVCALTVPPRHLAAGCGQQATVLSAGGLHVLPLGLTRLAGQLDPGQPAYALQVAELHARHGDADAAATARERLDETMRPYLGALIQEGRWRRVDGPGAQDQVSQDQVAKAPVKPIEKVVEKTVEPSPTRTTRPNVGHLALAGPMFIGSPLPTESTAAGNPAPQAAAPDSLR